MFFMLNFAPLKNSMASIKNLKQDLNSAVGEIIEGSILQQLIGDDESQTKADELIDDSIAFFDEMIVEINNKAVDKRSTHLKQVNLKIDKKLQDFVERLNNL